MSVLIGALKDCRADGYGMELDALPTTMSSARRIGAVYYFTGHACPNGHIGPRYTKGGRCCECTRISNIIKRGGDPRSAGRNVRANQKRLAAHSSKQKTYVPTEPCKFGHKLRFVASNNCVECNRDQMRRRAEKYAEKRIYDLYGLTADQHEALFIQQGRKCAICGCEKDRRQDFHIDHCHSGGHVRGLLCSKCNQAIGLFGENVDTLNRAIEYINDHS